MEASDRHPAPDRLSAFALGKLDDEQLALIDQHLSACSTCRAAAANSTDSFLELLLSARETPAESVLLAETSAPDRSHPVGRPFLHLPAELRDHPRYRVLRCLGRGGMGTVYLAEHLLMKQLRAIKVIKPAQVANPRAVDRFVREIELLSRLHHPHIVQAYDAEKFGEHYLLVMEYIEGETLAAVVERLGPLPVGIACEYARQAAAGLQYAHEKGLVHRDLKPANLMQTTADQVKILDFGLARLALDSEDKDRLTQDHAAVGTADYQAPEQALDARSADIRADIYSLGCTLFCLLTAKLPFGRPTPFQVSLAHLSDPPPLLGEHRPDAPAGLAELIQQMLAKTPEQRPQTPGEVAHRLAQLMDGGVPGSGRTPGSSPAEHPPLAQQPARSPGWVRCLSNRVTRWGSASLLLLVAVTLICWASGVLRVRTPNGTIVIEQVPDNAEVLVDGKRVMVKLPGQKEPIEVGVSPGRRQLELKIADVSIFSRAVDVDAGGRVPMAVRLDSLAPTPAQAKRREPTDADGFISLFNGEDLTGWRAWGGGSGGWEVEDGALVSRGQWRILYSDRGDFEDFHLRVEASIDAGGYSGIRFRCPFTPHDPDAYEVSINATSPNAQKTGSLRGIVPVTEQMHKPGDWFRLEIIAQGDHIVVKVNGRTTVSCTDPGFKKGHLALLGNNAPGCARFRKIEVKPLKPNRRPLSRINAGRFVPLFNGRDLTGWATAHGSAGGWRVEQGILVARGPVQEIFNDYGYFEDFHLRMEAMINDGGLAVVGFRAYRNNHRQGGSQAYAALLNATGPSPQRTGSLAVLAPITEVLHQPGEWFTLEIIARGDHIVMKVNGKTTVDHHDPRFIMGYILLSQETPKSVVSFRKIEIKELRADKSRTASRPAKNDSR